MPDSIVGPFVTRCNPTAEITSMLCLLYFLDDDDRSNADDRYILNANIVQTMQ